jgi:hypothetical protein
MFVSAEAVQQLERVIFKCSFNLLGGLQLDKEFRELSSYLAQISGWNVKEKCARLSQVYFGGIFAQIYVEFELFESH